MVGQPMVIGPFIRGLNNISTAGESEDTEVVELINMEVSLDRSLESRPPITIVPNTAIDNSIYKYQIYGSYFISDSEWYLIALVPTADDSAEVRAIRNGDFTDYVMITALGPTEVNEVPSDMVQFKDACYFLMPPESTSPGFHWSITGSKTNIPTMPKARVLISWKNRLWAAGDSSSSQFGDRVWFSSVDAEGLHPDKWEAANFFDTAPGEGGYVTAMVPFFNNLMIFKNDGTWRFSYSSSPEGGLVEKISGTVGSANRDCVIEFENVIYCYDQGTVYELVNSTFNPINIKLKARFDTDSDFSEHDSVTLSAINRRLFVRYRNSIYVYNAETKAWAQWRTSRGLPYKFIELPGDSNSALSSSYVAAQVADTYRFLPVDIMNVDPRLAVSEHIGTVQLAGNTLIMFDIAQNSDIYINPGEHISVGPKQKLEVTGKVTNKFNAKVFAKFVWYLSDNSSTENVVEITSPVGESFSVTAEAPMNAVYAETLLRVELVNPASISASVNMDSFAVNKLTGPVPEGALSLVYEYGTGVPQEIIDCHVTTKVYDFGQPGVFKRLFLWGLDIKTLNRITAISKITARSQLLTFGELTKHTHAELSTGTWGSPMRLQTGSQQTVDSTDSVAEQTDTNRFFIKLLKGLRFRQISFNIKTSTDGTVNTGPVKLYTITAYVAAKQMVVDKIS